MEGVRTRSIPTAAVLMLLGHEPIDVILDPVVAPTIRFAASAAPDLRRFLDSKARIEDVIRGSARR